MKRLALGLAVALGALYGCGGGGSSTPQDVKPVDVYSRLEGKRLPEFELASAQLKLSNGGTVSDLFMTYSAITPNERLDEKVVEVNEIVLGPDGKGGRSGAFNTTEFNGRLTLNEVNGKPMMTVELSRDPRSTARLTGELIEGVIRDDAGAKNYVGAVTMAGDAGECFANFDVGRLGHMVGTVTNRGNSAKNMWYVMTKGPNGRLSGDGSPIEAREPKIAVTGTFSVPGNSLALNHSANELGLSSINGTLHLE